MLPTGQIDAVIPGDPTNSFFTQWVSAHNLFAVLSFCIRAGLPRPPEEWRGRLPKWVMDQFLFHEGRHIPADYLSTGNFDYFGNIVQRGSAADGETYEHADSRRLLSDEGKI